MRTGFSLQMWIDIWLEELTPLVKTSDGFYEKLTDRYERTKKLIFDEEKDSQEWRELKRKHRESILGPDLIAAVPIGYTMTAMEKKYPQWHRLSLKNRARFIAHGYLENAEEIIKEHLRKSEENKKRLIEEKKGGHKG